MKGFRTILPGVLAGAAICLIGGSVQADPVKVLQGTEVKVRLLEDVEANGSLQNQIRMEVVEDVHGPKDDVLIAKGARAFASYSTGHKFGNGGKYDAEFTINRVYAIDGSPIPVVATHIKGGKSRAGAKALASAYTPFGIGGALIKGKKAKIKAGTEFLAQVTEDVTVDPSKPDSMPSTEALLKEQLDKGDSGDKKEKGGRENKGEKREAKNSTN